MFARSRGVWTEQQKLLADDHEPGDWFGASVAVDQEAGNVAATAFWASFPTTDFVGSANVIAPASIFGLLFADGFESHDTGAWSTTVGSG